MEYKEGNFTFKKLEIKDVILIEINQFDDERGYFEELFKISIFKKYIKKNFVQINHSYSKKGVLRGLHFQLMPKPQGKLIYVISGKIYDVAVDLRKGSPYYKKYVSYILTPGKALWIPEGFAHGFLALEDSNIIYLTTNEYDKNLDSGIRYDDPEIDIKWPFENLDKIIISEKDKNLPYLKDAKINFYYDELNSS